MVTQTNALAPAVARMVDRLDSDGVCMHGFTLTQHGQTVAEGSWAPFQNDAPHRMFSVSKSMTSLAVGLLQADGKLKLTDRICAYFPDKLPDPVPDALAHTTLCDMLRMATCHRQTTYKLADDDDWTRTFFTVPPTHAPGTVFCYDTSASHTLAALVQRLTGMPLLDFLQRRLFDSLGATDEKRWMTDPVGVCQGGTGLVMTLHDLTKVAEFCMAGGKGTPLEGYLREATQKQIETPLQSSAEERFGYGYQFWRTRHNGFAMYGLGGQLAVCLPDRETVFCTTADTQLDPIGVQKIYRAFWQEVYPALSGAPCSQAAWDALHETLHTLALRTLPNDDAFARCVGRDYAFASNPMQLQTLRLAPHELTWENAAGRCALPFGKGEWVRSVFPGTQEPCIASAGWIAPALLRLTCHIIGDSPCGLDMLLAFKNDFVTVQMQSVREIYTASYSGIASGQAVPRR